MRNAPVRFRVSLNGKVLATAGFEQFGVLSTIIDWVRRNPGKITEKMRSDPGFDEAQFLAEELNLNCGGLDSQKDKHVRWVRETIKIGDIITLEVLPPGEADEPEDVRFNKPAP